MSEDIVSLEVAHPGWQMSGSVAKITEALAHAQLKFDPVLKDAENPAFHAKYADLGSVIRATQPHLAANGIVVVQMPHAQFGDADAKQITLTTLLAHTSGEWIVSDLTIPAMMRERFDAQSVGSAVTYARRYAYSAMVGVAPEPDDDGNKAAGIGSKQAAQVVAAAKIAKAKGKAPEQDGVTLVPWKANTLAITGNGLAIVRASMTEEEKKKFTFKHDKDARGWILPAAQAHAFASVCERLKVPVLWADEEREPGTDEEI